MNDSNKATPTIKANPWMMLAGLNGFVAVGASAMGSHFLKSRLDEYALNLFSQAADYQMSHALALLGVGILQNFANQRNQSLASIAGYGFLVGVLLFSGSLYYLALNGPGSLGVWHWLTPLGGVALLFGWMVLTIAGWTIIWRQK